YYAPSLTGRRPTSALTPDSTTSGDLRRVSILLLFPRQRIFSAHIFTRLKGAEYLLPTAAGIEDRHIENEHAIVGSFPALKNSSPASRGVAARSFDSWMHR